MMYESKNENKSGAGVGFYHSLIGCVNNGHPIFMDVVDFVEGGKLRISGAAPMDTESGRLDELCRVVEKFKFADRY